MTVGRMAMDLVVQSELRWVYGRVSQSGRLLAEQRVGTKEFQFACAKGSLWAPPSALQWVVGMEIVWAFW